MIKHRPSILNRPIRKLGQANRENIEVEARREEASLRQKQLTTRRLEDERLRSLYATGDERRAEQERIRSELDAHRDHLAMVREREAEVWDSR